MIRRMRMTMRRSFRWMKIVISAPLDRPLYQQAQAASILGGQNLNLAIEPSLGQTLARMPGVSSSFFGPAASRPIIRGLDGDRVRILQNGLNTIDASAASPDHAVSFDAVEFEVGGGRARSGDAAVRLECHRRRGECD
jgi:hypothetical protein